MQQRWRVVIVDDHPIVRRGLAGAVAEEDDFIVCGEAANAEQALAIVAEQRPDLAVVDLSLGSIAEGLGLVDELHGRHPDLRILVISMHDESLYAERLLRSGAHGYVGKDAPAAAMLNAMRTVLAGRIAVSEAMSQQLVRRAVDGNARPDLARLSQREFEVFSLIGGGMTTREIAAQLQVSPKTVETHRERIKQKLGIGGANELTVRAVRYRLEGRERD
jgi:DNA-binding NarL/FixJ family response regulator